MTDERDLPPSVDLDFCRDALDFLVAEHGYRRINRSEAMSDAYRSYTPLIYRSRWLQVALVVTDRERELLVVVAPRLAVLTVHPLTVDVTALMEAAGEPEPVSSDITHAARHERFLQRASFLRQRYPRIGLWRGLWWQYTHACGAIGGSKRDARDPGRAITMSVDRAFLSKAFAFAIAEAVAQLRGGMPAEQVAPRIRLEDDLLSLELVERGLRDAVLGPCLKYVELYIHLCAHDHVEPDFVEMFGVSQAEALRICGEIADHCWAAHPRLPAAVEAIESRL